MLTRNILLNPGPVTTTDSVKNALLTSDICHREKEFSDLLQQVCIDIVRVAGDPKHWRAIPFASSGTATVEACLSSLNYKNKRLLIINNGVYSQRMVDMAKCYDLPYTEFKSLDNQPLNLSALNDYLSHNDDIGFLAFVHHETSTGLLNPLTDIMNIAKQYQLITIVDAISSFAGVPINLEVTPVDFLCVSINKCLQAFPGLAFVIIKERGIKEDNFVARSYYLDLYSQIKSLASKGQMRFTAPIQLFYALNQALLEFFAEGAEQRFKRLEENSRILKEGIKALGFEFYVDERFHSPILISILEPEGSKFDFDTVHDQLLQERFTIYPGQTTTIPTFRIATIGDLHAEDIRNFLSIFTKILGTIGLK